MEKVLSILAAGTLALSASVQAEIIRGYGVYASTSTYGYCPSYCTGPAEYNTQNLPTGTKAVAGEHTYASAMALAELGGASSSPVLKAKASADEGKRGGARAFAVQGYNFTGTEAREITLNYSLHGVLSQNGEGLNTLDASLAILKGESLDWYPDFATLVFEVAFDPNTPTDGLFLNANNGGSLVEGSMSFELNPGESFFLVAELNAGARNGSVDGFNTFTMNFDDDSQLQAVVSSEVPVPAAAWLFGSAVLGLATIGRRRYI